MGCCSSTTTTKSATENSQFPNTTPPPPLPEEESVKQVLSETPIIPRAFRKSNDLRRIPYSFPKNLSGKNSIFINPTINLPPEEDVYEACSSQSECASFFTEENYPPDIRRISPTKMRASAIGKSPQAKSNHPSPPNRVRSRRDGGGFSPNTRKRDCGESSGRRSLSPAMRGSCEGKKGLGRSVSAGRKGMSLDRVKMKIDDRNQSYRENQWPPTSNESLENPLVSLECFIFL